MDENDREPLPFPRFFVLRSGRFGDNTLFIRCDSLEQSAIVLNSGAEIPDDGCYLLCRCCDLVANGVWRELSADEAAATLKAREAPDA